jgi:hypothetical protein
VQCHLTSMDTVSVGIPVNRKKREERERWKEREIKERGRGKE